MFARTDSDAGKISAFIVERDLPGVSTGLKEDKLGIRASSTTTVSFADVKLSAEHLLGEEGKGFKVAMSILNNGRTGLGGGAVGGNDDVRFQLPRELYAFKSVPCRTHNIDVIFKRQQRGQRTA